MLLFPEAACWEAGTCEVVRCTPAAVGLTGAQPAGVGVRAAAHWRAQLGGSSSS